MRRSSAAETPQQKAWRKVLRALNGAGIGAVVGGLLGAFLAVASAVLVGMAPGIMISLTTLSRDWPVYAILGAIPGVPAGFLLGTTIIIRNDRRRVIAGALFGLLIGGFYAMLWGGFLHDQPVVAGAIVVSGIVGGVVLTLLLTALRRRWGWWTRWEDPQDRSSSAVTEAGGNVIV